MFRCGVVAADEVGVHVVVSPFGVAESTPRYGDEVALYRYVHIAVDTVGIFAVVEPAVCRSVDDRDKVVAAYIDRTRAYQFEVAEDEVLAAREMEQSCLAEHFAFVVCEVYQSLAGQELALFVNFLAIAQRAATTRCAGILDSGFIKSLFYFVGNVKFGAEACAVDADKSFVLYAFEYDALRYGEVAIAAIEYDDIVVVDSILYFGAHVSAIVGEGDALSVGAASGEVIVIALCEARRGCPSKWCV